MPRLRVLHIAGLAGLALLLISSRPAAAAASADATGVVNINTASKAELQLLPGIGSKKADRIIEAREKRRFESTDQIRRVKGIGRGMLRKLKPYLAVSGPTTLTQRPPSLASHKQRRAKSARRHKGAASDQSKTPADPAEPAPG